MSSATDPAPDIGIPFWDFFQAFIVGNRVSLELHACHEEICDTYEAAVLGQMSSYEYWVTNMPTRIGKTKILEALPCWMFGELYDPQMLYGSYSDPLVKRSLAYVGRTLRMPWYIDIYGDHLHTLRAELVTTTEGGSLYGAGTSGTITGFGAGLKEIAGGFIALDDPAKPDEALSKVESAKVIQNFETTWKTRRNSDQFTPIIVNAQRLGPDDLPGYIMKTYPNKTYVMKFPCMVQGHSVFPDTWSDSTLFDLAKTRIGRFIFASQFQQEPISLGGNLIQVDKFMRYDWAERFAIQWDQIVITVDTALKTKEANDSSCFQAWGLANRRAYLLDQVHGKFDSPMLLSTAITFYAKIHDDFPKTPLRMVIEEKAAGTPLIDQMQKAGIPAEGVERDTDKVRRVQDILPYQESGLVYIPRDTDNEWVGPFVAECAEFKPDMTHAHDDRVDTFADGVKFLLGEALSILDLLGARPRR